MLHRESSSRITGWSQFDPIVGSACAMQTVRMARCVQYWNETQASLQGNARIVPEVIWNYSSARKLICQVLDFKTLHVDFFLCVCVYMATVALPKLFTCKHSFMTCGKRESFVLSAWLTQNPEGQGEWRRSPPQRPRWWVWNPEKPGRSPNHWDERWTSHKEWLVYLGVCQGDLHRTHNSTTLEHCKRNWTFTWKSKVGSRYHIEIIFDNLCHGFPAMQSIYIVSVFHLL